MKINCLYLYVVHKCKCVSNESQLAFPPDSLFIYNFLTHFRIALTHMCLLVIHSHIFYLEKCLNCLRSLRNFLHFTIIFTYLKWMWRVCYILLLLWAQQTVTKAEKIPLKSICLLGVVESKKIIHQTTIMSHTVYQ